MALDCVLAAAWDVLKMAYHPIKRQFGYVTSSKKYVEDLEKEAGGLKFLAERIDDASVVAQNNLRNVYREVEDWLKKAKLALENERDLLSRFNEADKTCCYGTLRDPICRHQFSRKAEDMIGEIQQLAQEGSRFGKQISLRGPPPVDVPALTPDDSIFESRASIIQDIMDALADNSNSTVGVHGMGGVGKSTLLEDVRRRIGKERLFDLVAKTDVSENPDIKRIQEDIAYALNLDIKEYQHETARATHLRRRLETEEKRVLIILDNLWEKLNLESVGIPCGHNNQVIKCKLLLTSRDRNILQREMGCDKEFLLRGLDEKEAKILFQRMVGDKVHRDEFRILVDKALLVCAGLPLLIATMAKHFKHADLPEWTDALTQIERCTNEGISAVINTMLQFSYDHLKSEQAKSLLHLCVSYGVSEPSVENLVRDGYGWGIFGTDCTMKEARERLSTLISTLQASHLLLDNGGADGFKIHDLVHEFVAKFILRNQPPLVLKDKDMLATQSWKQKLKVCSAVCFPYIDMKELPEELDCPESRICLLSSKNESFEVPDSYFNSMRKLEVLDLTGICLTRSPMPFQSGENLRTLSLESCSLEDVAILGKLKGLQVLSLARSKIGQLPKEIGQLVELRLLDLSYCSGLQIIEKGVLGSLINLEELYMEDSFDQWSAVDQASATNASLIELNRMKNLCTLHVCIRDLSVIPRDLNIEKVTKYNILIGHYDQIELWNWSTNYKGSRILKLKLNPESDIFQSGCIRTTLDAVGDLWMDGLNGFEQSICQLSSEGFPQLKRLHVQNSASVRFILKGSSLPAFKLLESLYLESLINLEKLCHGNVSSKSFSALTVVRVQSCNKLEVLFPFSLPRELPQLKVLQVRFCKLMRAIVESDDCGKVELRNLHVLKLQDLPNIKNFITTGTAPSSSTSRDQVGSQAFFNGQQVTFYRKSIIFITLSFAN